MAKEKNGPPKFPEIGARLSQFVKDSGEPSARQFALKAGITPAVLSNLMLGYSIPGGETLAALAAAYSTFDLNWLLTGKRSRTAATEAQLPPAVPSRLEEPTPAKISPMMTALPNLDELNAEGQIAYWKARYEKEARLRAEEREEREHEEIVRLIGSTGGQSFTDASLVAADEEYTRPFMVAETNPDYVEAPQPMRRIGFVYGTSLS